MTDLEQARVEIRNADEQIAFYFQKRMEAVRDVAQYKKERGLAIYDEQQEKRVIERNLQYVTDEEIKPYYLHFLEHTMGVSRQFQHYLMNGTRIAYSGVEGAFAHIASKKLFPDGTLVSFGSFEAAYNAVVAGACDHAVLPIENSYQGEVGQVMDLIFGGDLHINGVFDLPINQNLLTVKGARMEDITTVYSHPQALGQCDAYISMHGFETVAATNTAKAAKMIAESKDIHLAAIASIETAELYGLQVLDHDINESKMNTTRFAILSKTENTDSSNANSGTFLMMFTVNNVAGALAKAINIIGDYGFNMKALRSRPMKTQPWRYYFYVEAEGDERSDNGRKMLDAISEHCDMLKIIGRYTPTIVEDK